MFRTILPSILLGIVGVLVFRLAGWHEPKDTVLATSLIAFGLALITVRCIRAIRREPRRTRANGEKRRQWLAVTLTLLALLTPQAASLPSRTAEWVGATKRQEQAALQRRHLQTLQDLQEQQRQRERSAAQAQVALHVRLGDALGRQFDLRRAEYAKAHALAHQHGLDTQAVDQALQRMDAEIAALRPVTLDARIRLHALRTELSDVAPVHFADFTLELPPDVLRPSLQIKDIAALRQGQPIPVLAFAPLRRSPHRLQVSLLLDISGSMRGDRFTEAKESAWQLVQSLASSADLTILAFNDAVVRVLDQKTDARVGFQTMAALQAQGGTALLKAIDTSLAELNSRPGPRAVIVLTDGKDSAGGKPIHELLRTARDQQTVIHSIGLQTSETDFALLQHLAESTGGTFRTVDRVAELRAHFAALAATLTQPAYRVVVPATEGGDAVTVCIGTSHRLDFPASLTTARAAKR